MRVREHPPRSLVSLAQNACPARLVGVKRGSSEVAPRGCTVKGKLLILLLLATVALLTFSAVASAVGRPTAPTMTFISPSPSEGATLATNAVSFAFTYNRAPRLTKALTYELSGPTASSGACDTPTALKGGSSRSGKSFSDLANGSYTFTVSLTCIDGSSATATRHFTVSVAPPGHIYWSDTTKNTIGRAKMDGTGVQTDFITDAFAPSRLAVDGTHVYWANNSVSSSSIGRANLDGTEASHSFITGMLSRSGWRSMPPTSTSPTRVTGSAGRTSTARRRTTPSSGTAAPTMRRDWRSTAATSTGST